MEWHIEHIGPHEFRAFGVKREIHSSISEYQRIKILELYEKGISLILDDHLRVFEEVEYIYHEGFVHSVMLRHRAPERVLVIGDGDGGLIRELLKYEEMKKLDWVEIDEEVIAVCEKYLPSFPGGCRDDNRLSIIIRDGIEYLEGCNKKYDVILVSVTAEGGSHVSKAFYNMTAYSLLKGSVDENGIIGMSLDEVSRFSHKGYFKKIACLKEVFGEVLPFLIELPSFGTSWGFAICSDSGVIDLRSNSLADLRYFTANQSIRDFELPEYSNGWNETNRSN